MVSKELGNGVKMLHLGDERYKMARMSVNLWVPLRREEASLNALVVRLLARNCAKYPDFTALNRKLSMLYGAALYSNVQKVGESQVLSLSVAMIDNRFVPTGENVAAECGELLCEMLFAPALNAEKNAFREEDVETERRQLLEELAAEFNDKRVYSRKRCEEVMFPDEAYGISANGEMERIRGANAEELYRQWRKLLERAEILAVVTGKADEEWLAGPLCARLKDWERKVEEAEPIGSKCPEEVREVIERVEVAQAKLVMGFRSEVLEPDKRADALRLLSALFGGTPHSLLFRNVREKLSLCYYCIARSDRKKGVLFVESGVEEKNVPMARQEILNQLQVLCDGSFSDEELESAKRAVNDSFRSVSDSPGGLELWYLTQGGRMRSPEEVAEALGRVTREEIVEVAKTVKLDTVYLLSGKEETA